MCDQKAKSYVTTELLSELESIMASDVPKDFFDDFSSELESELCGADPESIPEANFVTNNEASVKGMDSALKLSVQRRNNYIKERRRCSDVSLPKDFEV